MNADDQIQDLRDTIRDIVDGKIGLASIREIGARLVAVESALRDANDLVERIERLESAKPATATDSDPICATCQHPRSCHNQGGCYPTKTGVFGPLICSCKAFVPVAEPEPDDPICQRPGCGHKRSDHHPEIDCGDIWPGGCIRCDECAQFLDTAPVTPEPIDPVLFHIAEAARRIKAPGPRIVLEIVFLELQGRSVLDDVMDEMLAYGLTS